MDQAANPSEFYMFISNAENSTQVWGLLHNGLYAREYAKQAETAGINYATYYADYSGMQNEDAGTMRVPSVRLDRTGRGANRVETEVPITMNMRSGGNFGHDASIPTSWMDQKARMHWGDVVSGSQNEALLFVCHAMGNRGDGRHRGDCFIPDALGGASMEHRNPAAGGGGRPGGGGTSPSAGGAVTNRPVLHAVGSYVVEEEEATSVMAVVLVVLVVMACLCSKKVEKKEAAEDSMYGAAPSYGGSQDTYGGGGRGGYTSSAW